MSSNSSAATAALTGGISNVAGNLLGAQFHEIHKNTWLKRLTAEGKKITVGFKKSKRSWVVFCVHDDTEALLEGYSEPSKAAAHTPEWVVSLQDTLHISHAIIPNSHGFEFVVTLSNEVVRFHAMSWDIMQEWVDTLRSKLREMKILSPCENLYTKLPEIRAPLLPTRDPTSPLPATPSVPAGERSLPRLSTSRVTTPSSARDKHKKSTSKLEIRNSPQMVSNIKTPQSVNNKKSATTVTSSPSTSTTQLNSSTSSTKVIIIDVSRNATATAAILFYTFSLFFLYWIIFL